MFQHGHDGYFGVDETCNCI